MQFTHYPKTTRLLYLLKYFNNRTKSHNFIKIQDIYAAYKSNYPFLYYDKLSI